MKSRVLLQISIDDERLAYLLESRLICVEDLASCDSQTKARLKALILRNAMKTQLS